MLDVAENGRVSTMVALPTGQVVLGKVCKGDGSLAWVKTSMCKDELYVASLYDDRRRNKRIDLWKWMDLNLPSGN